MFPLILSQKASETSFFRLFCPKERRKSYFPVYFVAKSVENLIFPFISSRQASKISFFRLFCPKKHRKFDKVLNRVFHPIFYRNLLVFAAVRPTI